MSSLIYNKALHFIIFLYSLSAKKYKELWSQVPRICIALEAFFQLFSLNNLVEKSEQDTI